MDNEMEEISKCSNAEKRHNFHRPTPAKRQDSWMGFKGRVYRIASTVVLPKNKRLSSRSLTGGDGVSIKTPTMSVKSLQIRREEVQKPNFYMRSISAQNEPVKYTSVPIPPRSRVLFAPKSFPIDEVEEVDSSATSSSSRSSATDSLSDSADEDLSFRPLHFKLKTPDDFNLQKVSNFRRSAERHFPPQSKDLLTFPSTDSLSSLSKEEYAEPMKVHMKKSMQFKIVSHDEPSAEDDSNQYGDYDESDDEDSLAYHDFYDCMPPPIFMLCITAAEVGFFAYYAKRLKTDYGYISKFSPAPLDSALIYDPTRRFEVWRYITYALVHSGYMHLINNIVVQLMLGIPLEMVHKWWRVLAIYFAGILAGSLATSITQPFNFLAGASAGVYALIAAHVSTVILNWKEMERPWIRVLVFLAFVIHDVGIALYFSYVVGEKTNVGYMAHLGGAVAGLLVGIHVLKNLQWNKWEKILWWFCIFVCAILLLVAIAWNIFRPDLFP